MTKSQIKSKSIFIFVLLFLLIASCDETEIAPDEKTQEIPEIPFDPYGERYGEKIDYQPFEINFQVNEAANDGYLLQVNVDIIEGSFILSHYAGDEFSGRFLISLDDNEYLSLEPSPTETPAPEKEIYFWADNKEVKKLKGDVVIKQNLIVKSKDDFDVKGFVSFTVEPSCGFYKTNFIISRNSGEIQVKKIGTELNPESEN